MFTLYSLVPCFISLLLMEGKPSYNHFELFLGKRPGQELSINCYCCFILAIPHMGMRFIVLSVFLEQRIDNHTGKTTQFRYNAPPTNGIYMQNL